MKIPAPDATCHYVGSCVDLFDEDGFCLDGRLPWADVSAFACADETAVTISRERFLQQVELLEAFSEMASDPSTEFLLMDGLPALYHGSSDTHFVFA